jgi:pimeloyl-ACP methyl ester carboxylesterase
MHVRTVFLAFALLTAAVPGVRSDPYLADFPYPYPVQRFDFVSQGEDVWMSYMDVKPQQKPNGRTVVLMHGKNFCGATWESAIAALAGAGYRVIVPDQIGFCRSAKPHGYQMSLHQLAANTHALLIDLKIDKAIIAGHSMGGMLAIRYALTFPAGTEALVLVNPIGLEDWTEKGVPPATIDRLYDRELQTDAGSIRAYQLKSYYHGNWRPAYDRWVDMLASMYKGDGGKQVAWSQARATDMLQTQPVVHELQNVKVPTLLLIGELDRTALGRDRTKPEDAQKLGNYPVLARAAQKRIPNAKLITFADLGHSPQVEAPRRFEKALIEGLSEIGEGAQPAR